VDAWPGAVPGRAARAACRDSTGKKGGENEKNRVFDPADYFAALLGLSGSGLDFFLTANVE
jgi:hypothetical protein